jgi:hypothetical protein
MENRVKKTTMLKNKIKRSIIETKERKEKLLIEQKLVESRIMMIVESESNTKNFHRLSEEKQQKIMYSLLAEINYLDEQGMINEQLWDFLGKIFGNSFGGAVETIVEPMVNSLLSSLGLGGYFKNFLVSFITTNPLELAKALKSCEALTTLIANSLSEAVFMMIQKDKGLSGDGYTFIRNALGGVVKDTKFANSLEKQLSGIVCELFGKMNDKASGVYDKLKTGMADSGGLGGLLDKGKTALASAV